MQILEHGQNSLERTKEIKETSETVKSKIEAVEEKTENIAKQTEETQAFQKTLEALKETISKDENKWGYISVGTVLTASLVFIGVFIIYIFFTKEAKSFFPAYFLFTFFLLLVLLCCEFIPVSKNTD